MSEKIYTLLLRLYPADFRETYGDDALQLFRDRWRDETGFFPRLRLWLDLLADLALSLPGMQRHAELRWASAGEPSFHVLEDESLRFGTWFLGAVLALGAFGAASQNSCVSDACALFLTLIQCGERRRLGRPLCCDCSQRLMARNGHGGAATACLLSGAERKTSTLDEYFPLRPTTDLRAFSAPMVIKPMKSLGSVAQRTVCRSRFQHQDPRLRRTNRRWNRVLPSKSHPRSGQNRGVRAPPPTAWRLPGRTRDYAM